MDVRQFRSGTVYVLYCRRCGSPDGGGQWHIAGIHPVRSGVNCDPCYQRHVMGAYRS